MDSLEIIRRHRGFLPRLQAVQELVRQLAWGPLLRARAENGQEADPRNTSGPFQRAARVGGVSGRRELLSNVCCT